MKNCPECGAENRDAANFCRVCREKLSAAPPLPPTAMAPVQPPTRQQPQVIPPYSPPEAPPLHPPQGQQITTYSSGKKSQRKWSWYGTLQADGYVNDSSLPREARLPRDPSRIMVIASLVLLFTGVIAAAFMAALTIFVVLMLFGVSFCLFPMLLMLFSSILKPLLELLRGRKQAYMLDLQVNDEISGAPVSVVIYLKEGAGRVRLGDRVKIFGQRLRGSRGIRAYRIKVLESGGQSANYAIPGIRPWPLWVGLLTLGTILCTILWFYFENIHIP